MPPSDPRMSPTCPSQKTIRQTGIRTTNKSTKLHTTHRHTHTHSQSHGADSHQQTHEGAHRLIFSRAVLLILLDTHEALRQQVACGRQPHDKRDTSTARQLLFAAPGIESGGTKSDKSALKSSRVTYGRGAHQWPRPPPLRARPITSKNITARRRNTRQCGGNEPPNRFSASCTHGGRLHVIRHDNAPRLIAASCTHRGGTAEPRKALLQVLQPAVRHTCPTTVNTTRVIVIDGGADASRRGGGATDPS